MLKPHNHPVESHGRTALRNYIIQSSTLLEIAFSGLVLIGLLFSIVPLLKWMPGLLFDGNDAEIRTFLERALDIVIGIEFIKMLAKHSPGSSLEVLLYAIARHMVVGHESAVENLLSVGAIALIFVVRKFFFVPAFGAHLPDGNPAPTCPRTRAASLPRSSASVCMTASTPRTSTKKRTPRNMRMSSEPFPPERTQPPCFWHGGCCFGSVYAFTTPPSTTSSSS
ncbi:MAG: hypothetical protein PUF15_01125 [Faecalibacterium prausnitzii]|nr:hypothetical protein [Faecalibacterium prausnitzii]